jgi:hypothetical protein
VGSALSKISFGAGAPELAKPPDIRGKRTTTISLFSRSNKKPGDGQKQYLRKRHELGEAGVNLAEIDLLREEEWVVAVPLYAIAPDLQTPYRVVVRRGWRRFEAEYDAIALSDPLPRTNVRPRQTDADVPPDLEAFLDRCFENGRYDGIDRTKKPRPAARPSGGALGGTNPWSSRPAAESKRLAMKLVLAETFASRLSVWLAVAKCKDLEIVRVFEEDSSRSVSAKPS